MAATWSSQSPQPPFQGSVLITDVEVGDKIDIQAVIGRPARKLTIITTDAADTVQYRVNNLRRSYQVANENRRFAPDATSGSGSEVTEWWSAATDLFNDTGLTITFFETIAVSSIEIVGLTLSTGSTVQIVVV